MPEPGNSRLGECDSKMNEIVCPYNILWFSVQFILVIDIHLCYIGVVKSDFRSRKQGQ